MIIKLFISLILCLTFTLSATPKALIWQVTSSSMPGKLYIIGSIHVGKEKWYPLDQVYDRVLKESSVVYFEIYKPNALDLQQEMFQYMLVQSPEQSVSAYLSAAENKELAEFLAAHVPLMRTETLAAFRPWFISLLILQQWLKDHPQYSEKYGIDKVFMSCIGNRQGMSLESISSQIKAIAAVPDRDCARDLMETVHTYSQAGKEIENVISAVETGKTDHLDKMVQEISVKSPAIYQNIYVKRNKKMSRKLCKLLQQKRTVLIVVGAAHFVGKDSILNMLKEKNCRIIQLDRSGAPGKITP